MLASGAWLFFLQTPSWPAWRGPEGTNVSRESGWSSEGAAAPLWKVAVGRGHSSFAVVGARLYTLGFDEERACDRVQCLATTTGAELWRHEYAAELDADAHGGGTHGTPAVAEGVVYAFERQGVLRALDAEHGRLLWQRDLCAEEGAVPTEYGFGGSPVVVGELVLVHAAKVVALERASGATRWVSEDLGAYYSTPALCRVRARDCVASFARPGLHVLTLVEGEPFAFFPFQRGEVSVSAATPVVLEGERLFISSAYGHGAALVDFSGAEPRAEWETRAMRTQLSGCVYLVGAFFGFDENVFKCLDRAGKERWRTRGLGQGALTAADGRLIVISGKGELVVLAANAEKYEVLSQRPVLEGSTFWASPVLCDGRIYARSGEGELVALDHRPSPAR